MEETTVQVDARGRLVLPAKIRKRLGIRKGEILILTVEEDGTLRLLRPSRVVEETRGLVQKLVPHAAGRSLVQELIDERRQEAKRENKS